MTPLEIARRSLESKKAAAKALADSCTADGVTREFTADESKRFNDLAGEIRSADKAVKDLEATEEPTPNSGDGSSVRSRRIDGAAAVHTTDHRYDYMAALRAAYNKNNKAFTGLEGEVHEILLSQRGKDAPTPRGILVPSGYEANREIRKALYGKNAERRDATFNTTAAAPSIFPHEMPFIDLIRNSTVLKELGVTWLMGLDGILEFPRQTGGTTAYWLAEGDSVGLSNPTLDQVELRERTIAAATRITRKTLHQSSLDVANWIRNDQALQIALKLEASVINSDGNSGFRKGLCQDPAIQAQSAGLAIGTDGGVPTYKNLVAMQSQIASIGGDRNGPVSYLVTPAMKGVLKGTPRLVGSASASAVWGDDDTIDGLKAVASNLVPTGLTKGASNALCQAIIALVAKDVMIGQWGGLDVQVNDTNERLAGNVIVSTFAEFDYALRHPQSVALITDAKVA